MTYRLVIPLVLLPLVAIALACAGGGGGGGGGSTPVVSPQPDSSPPVESPQAGGSPAAGSPQAAACPPPSGTPPQPTAKRYEQRPTMTIDPAKKYLAVVKTVRGDFTIELRPDIAPETVNSFVFLAREGYFDGVTFHRVIRDTAGQPDFVAQTGDPTGTGAGNPGYTLPAEFSDVPFERGTVGMARTADPNSGGSQFFITYTDEYQDVLNGRYTVFGQVVEGMDVVDCITPRDPSVDPTAPPGDAIITIEIREE